MPLSLGHETNVAHCVFFPLDPHPQDGPWTYDGPLTIIIILKQSLVAVTAQWCLARWTQNSKLKWRPYPYCIVHCSLREGILNDAMFIHVCLSVGIGTALVPGNISKSIFLLGAIDKNSSKS